MEYMKKMGRQIQPSHYALHASNVYELHINCYYTFLAKSIRRFARKMH